LALIDHSKRNAQDLELFPLFFTCCLFCWKA
jgi:hypothetical protein